MDLELLKDIGFTKSEIAVYFALLELGQSTTGPIIREANIASGKAYLILDKLILKGLVTFTIKNGTKFFQAKDPDQLLVYVEKKEKEFVKKKEDLARIIPKLKAQYEEKKYKPKAEVYEGARGFKTFYDWVIKELKKGDCINIMGVPREANEKFPVYLMQWNKKRISKGIKMRIIYNHDCKKFGQQRGQMKLTKVRYMRQELETPAWIDIFGDYVATINVHGTPVCFLIRDKESADSYNKYFEILWKQSRE